MKTLKEYLEWIQVIETIEYIDLIDESEMSSTNTVGVENPDSKPMIKKTKVFGHPCVEVDSDTYHKCVKGKQPFERWAKYVEDETLRDEMRKTFQRNSRVLIMNSQDGTLAYVK